MIAVIQTALVVTAIACLVMLTLLPPQRGAVGPAQAIPSDGAAYFKELAKIGKPISLNQETQMIKQHQATTTIATTTTFRAVAVKPGRSTPPAEQPNYELGTIEALIAAAFPENPSLWISIARCESGLNTSAHNAEGASGLFQVMTPLHNSMLQPGETMFDPQVNIRIARSLSRNGTSTAAWVSSKGCWS